MQSNYIPWKGYFDIIGSVDEFIFYDDVQYTKNDWRNRNKIKTSQGLHWLTIPVRQFSSSQKINETKVVDNFWKKKHLKTLKQWYSKAKYFQEYERFIEELYETCDYEELSQINYHFINRISKLLGISTRLSWCRDYNIPGEKTERLVGLVKSVGGTEYVSGPSAKSYLQTGLFENEGINVSWMDYTHYLEYEQLYPPFEHGVSILDLIFNTGPNIRNYMRLFK